MAGAGASPKVRMTQLSSEKPRVIGGGDAGSTRRLELSTTLSIMVEKLDSLSVTSPASLMRECI